LDVEPGELDFSIPDYDFDACYKQDNLDPGSSATGNLRGRSLSVKCSQNFSVLANPNNFSKTHARYRL